MSIRKAPGLVSVSLAVTLDRGAICEGMQYGAVKLLNLKQVGVHSIACHSVYPVTCVRLGLSPTIEMVAFSGLGVAAALSASSIVVKLALISSRSASASV